MNIGEYPECMAPDGGDPCQHYIKACERIKALELCLALAGKVRGLQKKKPTTSKHIYAGNIPRAVKHGGGIIIAQSGAHLKVSSMITTCASRAGIKVSLESWPTIIGDKVHKTFIVKPILDKIDELNLEHLEESK